MNDGQAADPFHNAILAGDARAAIGMLDGGFANLGADVHGRPPILLATLSPDAMCLQILLERGFDPNRASQPKLTTPAMIAARRGHADALAALIHAGCDLHAQDHEGTNASMAVCQISKASAWNNPWLLKRLIDAGCDIDIHDHSGRTAAMHAIDKGMPDCLRLLIQAGCDLNARSFYGMDALELARVRGRLDCLALIEEHQLSAMLNQNKAPKRPCVRGL